jgi:hypothetical protein
MGGRCSEDLAGPVPLARGAVKSTMFSSNRLVLRRLRFAGPLMLTATVATIASHLSRRSRLGR